MHRAIVSMVCNSLSDLLQGMEDELSPPLFSLEAILSVPEIVIHPPGSELFKMYTHAVNMEPTSLTGTKICVNRNYHVF